MTRTLKILGLAVMAMGALYAVAASGASAAEFHCEGEPCTLTGTTEEGTKDKFTASGFTVEAVGHFYGTATVKTETTQTIYPEYTNSTCTSTLGACSIDTTGCSYVFTSHTNATGHLPVSISCAGTNVIKVTAPGCTLSFGSQATVGGAKATNIGSGSSREVTVDTTTKATFSTSGAGCFVITGDTGEYTAKSNLSGWVDGGPCPAQAAPPYSCSDGLARTGVWWE